MMSLSFPDVFPAPDRQCGSLRRHGDPGKDTGASVYEAALGSRRLWELHRKGLLPVRVRGQEPEASGCCLDLHDAGQAARVATCDKDGWNRSSPPALSQILSLHVQVTGPVGRRHI
jgi:phage gp46-like protein